MKISSTNVLNYNEQIVYSTILDNDNYHSRHTKEEYIICSSSEYTDIKKFIIKYSLALSNNTARLLQCRNLMKVSPYLLYVVIKSRIEKSKPIELEGNMTYYDLCKMYALDNGAVNESKEYDSLNVKLAVSQATGNDITNEVFSEENIKNEESANQSLDENSPVISDYGKELFDDVNDKLDIEQAKEDIGIDVDKYKVNNPLETTPKYTGIEVDSINDMNVIEDIAIKEEEEREKEKKQTLKDFVIQKPVAEISEGEIEPETDKDGNIKLHEIEYKGDNTKADNEVKYRVVDAPISNVEPIRNPSFEESTAQQETVSPIKKSTEPISDIITNDLSEQDKQNLHEDLLHITQDTSDLDLNDGFTDTVNMFGTVPIMDNTSKTIPNEELSKEVSEEPPQRLHEKEPTKDIKPYNAIDIYNEDLSKLHVEKDDVVEGDVLEPSTFLKEKDSVKDTINDAINIANVATCATDNISKKDDTDLIASPVQKNVNTLATQHKSNIPVETNSIDKSINKKDFNKQIQGTNNSASIKSIDTNTNNIIKIEYLPVLLTHKDELFNFLLSKATTKDIEQFIYQVNGRK